MTALKEELKYCMFIDVLGYGNIVTSQELSTEQKISIFSDIYMNLFHSISNNLKTIQEKTNTKIYLKSFSDSVYLECDNPLTILYAAYRIFNITYGYYGNIPNKPEQKYTPFLRSGIVNDWTLKIMDIAALTKRGIDEISENDEFSNMIGLGVARSYYTAEKSNISGMRVIVSPETLKNVTIFKFEKVPFECYFIEYDDVCFNETDKLKLFITPIKIDEKEQIVNLYELIWPVFLFQDLQFKPDIYAQMNILLEVENNFDSTNKRHLQKTAEIIQKAYCIMRVLYNEEFQGNEDITSKAMEELERIILNDTK